MQKVVFHFALITKLLLVKEERSSAMIRRWGVFIVLFKLRMLSDLSQMCDCWKQEYNKDQNALTLQTEVVLFLLLPEILHTQRSSITQFLEWSLPWNILCWWRYDIPRVMSVAKESLHGERNTPDVAVCVYYSLWSIGENIFTSSFMWLFNGCVKCWVWLKRKYLILRLL